MSTTSVSRADRTLATRRRMVRAAYELFSTHGYLGTTVAAVAQQAGVAVPTIYYTFGTKAALLGESLGAAIVGFDRWREPPLDPGTTDLLLSHQWWGAFQAAATAEAAFDVFISNGAGILERVSPLVAAVQAAAGDPEAAGIIMVSEQRRVES